MRPRRLGLAGPALLVLLCSAAPAAADPAVPLPDPVPACPSITPAAPAAGLGPLAAVGGLPVLAPISPALSAVGRAVDPRCGLVAGALGPAAAPPAPAARPAARPIAAQPAVGGLDADLPVRLYSFTGQRGYQDLPAAVPGQFAPAPAARYGGVPGRGAAAPAAAPAGAAVQDAGQAGPLPGTPGGIGLPLLAAVLALSGATAALVRTVALRRLP